MKLKLLLVLVVCGIATQAQTKVEKSITVRTGQKLVLLFDYPDVRLQTWDKPEILIRGTASINRGENDNAFELGVAPGDKEITVTSIIKDKENIPQRIVIKKGDTEYFFKARNFNDPEVQKFLEENGREYTYMSNGIIKEIKLEVFVPKGMETLVQAKYGMVEAKDFDAPLSIESKYGGVDATITDHFAGQLTARSRYGEILTNLDLRFDQKFPDKNDKWTEISKAGLSPRYLLESKYGNVYLRKSH